ncbi:hypothetical protein FB468_1104 [Leucobacter komagatae]|uniref:CopC domain-containing protein n=1 Tax=Leucobacter komagatae TaxID=55969 RepID=A0A542Y4U1_9MICO|nr:copper resistance CopC family protein [Leucobacter komagatae]TQL43089.1 hypothetical protein FB468_1104 [Leucobacter komagatae]
MPSHTHTQGAAPKRRTLATLMTAACVALGFAAFASPAAPANAHDQLIDVAVESSEAGDPSSLRLTFSDNVLDVGAEIHVTAPDGGDATGGLPTFSGRDVVQPFATPLADGTYTSAWRVVSSDGHPIEGGFMFDIENGAAGEVRPYTGEAETDDASTPEGDADAGSEGAKGAQSLTLPLAIGGAAVVAVAIAIPMIVRMRKSAASAEGTGPRENEE